MKKISIIFLQIVIVALGSGVLVFMLWEPYIEGRNVSATLYQIYFNDPFLMWVYTASIAFFVGLYQAFMLLRYIGQNKIFTRKSIKALQIIKYCGMAIVGFVVASEACLFIVQPGDDIAGGVFIGLLVVFASGVVSIVAGVFESMLQKAVEMKLENDLTF